MKTRVPGPDGRPGDVPLTDLLCTRCGLCCDGTLLSDVELAGRRETERAEALGLVVDEDDADGPVMPLPCGALHGRRCSVYPHRPGACRAFECALLLDAKRGTVTADHAMEVIADTLADARRARQLIRRLGHDSTGVPLAEAAADALAVRPAGGPRRRDHRNLAELMDDLGRRIRTRFLGRTRSRAT